MLKKLGLPDFCITNWQSTIRDEVRIHPKYQDLTTFHGRETSDIVYDDTSSALTEKLCQSHYLDKQIWTQETPRYYIEVKTTTEACQEAFYVSSAQFKRVSMRVPFPG